MQCKLVEKSSALGETATEWITLFEDSKEKIRANIRIFVCC